MITLTPDMDGLEAIRKLLKHKISGAPVVTPQFEFLGVFSEKCSMRLLLDTAYEEMPSNTVEAFMDRDIKRTITADHDLLAIAEIFLSTPYRRLPVLSDNRRLVGQVSRRDVLNGALQQVSKSPRGEKNHLLYLSAIYSRDESPIRAK
jgi:CBS domain-containing protein